MTEPTWYTEATKEIGTREIPGAKSNSKILGWAKRLGSKILGMSYTNDDTPWCGLLVAECISRRGLKLPAVPVRASSWGTWGKVLDMKKPMLGAILVFTREGGGHVGFCAGYTDTHFKVLGGNQGNAVSYTWIARNRCTGMRWPAESVQVPTPAPKYDKVNGTISKNEA